MDYTGFYYYYDLCLEKLEDKFKKLSYFIIELYIINANTKKINTINEYILPGNLYVANSKITFYLLNDISDKTYFYSNVFNTKGKSITIPKNEMFVILDKAKLSGDYKLILIPILYMNNVGIVVIDADYYHFSNIKGYFELIA